MNREQIESRERRLEQVIALSQEMLDSADRGQWDEFASLEQRRRPDMLACFEFPVSVTEAPRVRAHIEQLMVLNERLTTVLQTAREESARQFRNLQKGRSAINAYAAAG